MAKRSHNSHNVLLTVQAAGGSVGRGCDCRAELPELGVQPGGTCGHRAHSRPTAVLGTQDAATRFLMAADLCSREGGC